MTGECAGEVGFESVSIFSSASAFSVGMSEGRIIGGFFTCGGFGGARYSIQMNDKNMLELFVFIVKIRQVSALCKSMTLQDSQTPAVVVQAEEWDDRG